MTTINGKYESEARWVSEDTYGREHFSVHSGFEGATEAPSYWHNYERDPIGQLGVSYARNASKVIGDKALKAEVGYQVTAAGTLSASIYDPTNFQTAGLMYSDLTVEGKIVTGLFYQPDQNITLRSGLASGADLDNIDGTQIAEQMGNIAESDAYIDLRFGHGVVAGNILGEIPLHDPSQYKVGAGVAIAPFNNNSVVIAATYLQERIVTDTIDKVRIGAEVRPVKQVAVGANVSTPVMGDNSHDLTASGYIKVMGF